MTAQDGTQIDDVVDDDFLLNRKRILTRVVGNHARWTNVMRGSGKEISLTEPWTDEEGIAHQVVITPSFLLAHLKLQRSLISDMEAFGSVGRVLADRILLEQRNVSDPTTPFPHAPAPPDSTEGTGC
jgi:hypothetical protein